MTTKALHGCIEHGSKQGVYCNECGKALIDFAIGPDTFWTWRVTTEDDEEGRRTRNLGTHTGKVADIARVLASNIGYTLHFMPAAKCAAAANPRREVHVRVDTVDFTVRW